MVGGIRLHHSKNKVGVQFLLCESRSCQYDKIDDAYSWEHVEVLGWTIKPADIWNMKKASGINPDLITEDGVKVEIYCPLCSEELRS